MGDRHLIGVGAAACAVCCAAPLLAAIGIVGAAATVATAVFAGAVFAVVVGVLTLLVAWRRRKREREAACAPHDVAGVQDLELLPTTRVEESP